MSKSGIFSKLGVAKTDLDLGEGRFSRQLLPLFQTCDRRINQSGGTKCLFYENGNFTRKKFNEPVVPPLRDPRGTLHRACSRLVCACAGGARRMSRWLRRFI